VLDDWELKDDLSTKEVFVMGVLSPWGMFFDSAVQHNSAGARVVLVSPEKHIFSYSFTLS